MDDADLLDEFVALFEPIATFIDPDPIPPAGRRSTDRSVLGSLYARLPARFPKLYERLILTYRWQSATIRDGYRLLANPNGTDFSGLEAEIFCDEAMSTDLLAKGYIQLGFVSDCSYDPICFQTNSRSGSEYPIVHLDHEQILCYSRIKVIGTIAGSFRAFILDQLAEAGAATS